MQFLEDKKKILIIDFGSQVTKLIARRIRDLGVYSEVITPIEIKKIKSYKIIEKKERIWKSLHFQKKGLIIN